MYYTVTMTTWISLVLFVFFTVGQSSSCADDWPGYENACYKYFPDAKSKDDAAATCEAEGAYHVDIHSLDENNFVKGLVPTDVIGVTFGYKRNASGDFVWDRTNEAGAYGAWDSGEPNNAHGNEGCGVMYISHTDKAGKWNDVPCNVPFPFVCKRSE